jgi:hypothetical protein
MTTSELGVLRTAPQYALDEPGHFGDQSPRAWDLIPGRKVRNDGVYAAILLPGSVYNLEHDGTGWQLTPEGTRPHAYLTDDQLQPAYTLELAHRLIALNSECRYSIERDGTGAWRLLEHAGVPV